MTHKSDTLWYDYETELPEAPRSRIGAVLRLASLGAIVLMTYLAVRG